MTDYQLDLQKALLWLVGSMGGLIVTIGIIAARRYESAQRSATIALNLRLDAQDRSLQVIKLAVDSDARQLRDVIHDMDRRLMRIEADSGLKDSNGRHRPPKES